MPDFHKPTMIKSNGINLAVYEQRPVGNAHQYPVVMVHGMPELAYSWRLQFEALVKAAGEDVKEDEVCGKNMPQPTHGPACMHMHARPIRSCVDMRAVVASLSVSRAR